jgi:hypothetical protein
MFTKEVEPRYVVNTFGMGNNHGGTGMFIEKGYNSNISHTNYFSALNYDKACQYADEIALQRGDTKSIPVRTNCGNTIEVIINEVVNVNPAKDHGDGDEFINSIESGIRAGGVFGGLMAISQGLKRH